MRRDVAAAVAGVGLGFAAARLWGLFTENQLKHTLEEVSSNDGCPR